MHKTRYNALSVTFHLVPKGPLLVKAGGISANPSLPDMQFVRTYHPERGEVLYIPGSSLKGVVRGFIEKVLRTLNDESSWRWACATFPGRAEGRPGGLGSADKSAITPEPAVTCASRLGNLEKSATIYSRSCGACRIFGHTRLKGRASFTDLTPATEIATDIRYGVAISRLSHAVAQGPFEMEVAVSGAFEGRLVLENFEIWQLALLALAIESINQGLVKVGFGKNRGLGHAEIRVQETRLDEVTPGLRPRDWRGLAAFVSEAERQDYGLADPAGITDMPEPTSMSDLGLYTRRVYGADKWTEISRRAVEAVGTA